MATINPTISALNAAGSTLPGMNQKLQRQQRAASDLALQKYLGMAEQPKDFTTQLAAQTADAALKKQQQSVAFAQQLAGQTLAAKKVAGEQDLATRQLAQQKELEAQRLNTLQNIRRGEAESKRKITDEEINASSLLLSYGIDQDNSLQIATLKQREDLNKLGLDIKQKLIDSRLQFETENNKRKFSNERQLADYTILSARNKLEANEKLTMIQRTAEKKSLILKQAQAQIKSALERGYIKEKGDLDFETKKYLAQLKSDTEAAAKREEAAAKNRAAILNAGVSIAAAYVMGGMA